MGTDGRVDRHLGLGRRELDPCDLVSVSCISGADKNDARQCIAIYIAAMEQTRAVIEVLRGHAASISDVVARDIAAGVASASDASAARTAVDWLLAEIETGDCGRPAAVDALRDAARNAAAAGRSVASVLDPYLSAGWAIWDAAVRLPEAVPSLPRLGAVILRAGDAAAAAIAAAYADADAAQAARTASARREFLDELLMARPGDPSLAGLARRAPAHGLAGGVAVRAILAAADRDLMDDDSAVSRLEVELGPRAPIVATDRGRALILTRADTVRDAGIQAALDVALGAEGWTAVAVVAGGGLSDIGRAVETAHAALGIAVRLGRRGTIEPPEATLLEQTLLGDEQLLARAVQSVLGPLETTPRTGPVLVRTLRVYVETAGNRRATARRLGVAPRTVAYRLERIETRLKARLVGPGLLRLAVTLFARDLLESAHALPASSRSTVTPRRDRG